MLSMILIICTFLYKNMKTIEIAFVGSVSAGKTSLVKRCLGQGFQMDSTRPTLGMQFHSATIIIGKETYKCNFVDSQGFDNNLGVTMIPLYKRFHGFIAVYDVTDRASFENSKRCFEEISQNCQIENQNVAFVGNKNDKEAERKVTNLQASQYCLERQIYYVETSALKNDHIKKIIEMIAKNLICSGKIKTQSTINPQRPKNSSNQALVLNRNDVNEAKKKGCWSKITSFFAAVKNFIF